MTELEKLRQEVQELREQMNKKSEPKPWTKVKAKYSSVLKEHYQVRDVARLESAINTMVRFSLGLRRVGDLEEEDVPKAERVAFEMIAILGFEEEHLNRVSNE